MILILHAMNRFMAFFRLYYVFHEAPSYIMRFPLKFMI